MNKLYESLRINIDKAFLGTSRALYCVSGGLLGKQRFTSTSLIKHIGTDVKIISEKDDEVTIAKTDKNGKIVNKGFRILSTSDMHLGDSPKMRKKVFDMLMSHINATRPDLVILTGDIILGKYQHIDAIEFAQFMEKVGIYWAFTFGNHEAREEKGRFKELLMKCQIKFPHCLARQGKKELFGLCNYCINILKSESENLKTLYFFDSGRNILPEYRAEQNVADDVDGYDYLKKNQMEWYTEKVVTMREKYGEGGSFMYMHIPLKEYDYVIETERSEDKSYKFTDKCDVVYGKAYELVGSSKVNSGMFELMKKLDSTKAVFCGHDHLNGFSVLYDGIYLVYNQCCGYETYKLDEVKECEEKEWLQGVTITEIFENGKFDISPRYNSLYLV